MIRRLTDQDRLLVLDYLYQEPEFNIFPIGDIETFGFNTDFQRVYGEFDDESNLLSIFLRYRVHAIYYSDRSHFNQDYLSVFKSDPFKHLSGKSELIDLMKPYLKDWTFSEMYFCKANRLLSHTSRDHQYDIKTLNTRDDAKRLHDLLLKISDFRITQESKAFIDGKMQSLEMGECLYIENQGKIISTVSTTAETTKSAMVVAVATDADYRKQGLASQLMVALMLLYFNQKKKSLCLFYDNPDAGKIYMRLGFEPIGKWTLCDQE